MRFFLKHVRYAAVLLLLALSACGGAGGGAGGRAGGDGDGGAAQWDSAVWDVESWN